ncbi:hypothetical protein STEG23_003721 [Scotinomys teguina]
MARLCIIVIVLFRSKMPGKANASKRKSKQLKRNSEQRADEVDLPENEVGNTAKRNRSHSGHLSSKATGQAKSITLKRIKVASNKRTTWQPLPKNTEEYLQSMMESVILEILNKNNKGKEQIQYHLNYLKKRLLQQCGTLKVPPRKLNYLTDVSNLLKIEKAQERANEEDLALLQEEIDKIVETTESMTESIQSLKNKIQILTSEVEEEEQTVKQEFLVDNNKVLPLPELSQKSLKAPTLQAETDNLDHYTNAYAVFYKDVRAYQQLLEERDVINWDQVFQIQGLQSEIYAVSKAVANAKQLDLDIKLASFKAVHFSPVSSVPDHGFLTGPSPRLTYLSVSDADLLNRTWSRGGNQQCLRYIAKLIACFPSVCVRDEKGNPVSWGITDQFATMCHGYTLPDHRRKGYSRLVALTLARKLQSRGFPSQGNVLDDNVASINLLKSVQAEFLPCRFHRLILTPATFSRQAHL